jgi:hypothetical protein
MDNGLSTVNPVDSTTIERVLLHGDLRQLSAAQKLSYYNSVCKSLGLNPLTQPFSYIVLNGKETLYARRECTEQLAQIHGVSFPDPPITKLEQGVYSYVVRVVNRDGRTVYATGAVGVEGLKGEALANAILKAETKAHRRGTLKICGLGMLDETEVESVRTVECEKGKVSLAERTALLAERVRAADPLPVTTKSEPISTPLGDRDDDLIVDRDDDLNIEELNATFPPESIEAEDLANGLEPELPPPSPYADEEAWWQTVRQVWAEAKPVPAKKEIFYRLKNEYQQYLPKGTRLLEALPVRYREPFVWAWQQRVNELGNQRP